MPQRIVFTNPDTGRFVSSEDAFDLPNALRRVYDGGRLVEEQILSFGSLVEDLTQGSEPNWKTVGNRWGEGWAAEEGNINFSALQDAEPPSEATGYRVVYNVLDNPDYPRGFATSETLDIEHWPPRMDLVDNVAVTGIARVYFRRPSRES